LPNESFPVWISLTVASLKACDLSTCVMLATRSNRPQVYDAAGADELVFLDISATPRGHETVREMVRQVADRVFLPFTVGGGIRTVEDMRLLLLAGADKVSINSAAVRSPELLRDGADRFGSQCIVLAIDARRFLLERMSPRAGRFM
jgi:imidazole glycerol phosphate synthase subunit HisF